MSMRFIRPSLHNIPNKIMGTEGFACLYPCDFESRSQSRRLQPKVAFSGIYHKTKFKSNKFTNNQMHANVEGFFFFDAVSKTRVISLNSLSLSFKVNIRMFNLHCLNTKSISS